MKCLTQTSDTEETDDLQVYEVEDIAELMLMLQKHWRVMFILALAAGLRRRELLGLEWEHIDFDNNKIQIRTIIVLTKKRPHIKKTKTRSSRRTVTLPQSIMDELLVFREQYEMDKSNAGEKWIEEEYHWVFCQPNGKHIFPSSPSNRWSKMLKEHDFRYIRLHDLRHTSASLLIAQGVHAKIISERLGHSDISVTMNTYGHAFKSADRAAADKLESIFKTKVIGVSMGLNWGYNSRQVVTMYN